METDGGVEKQRTVFPHLLAKRLGVSHSSPQARQINHKQQKPDRSFATKTGHFYLLPTLAHPKSTLDEPENTKDCDGNGRRGQDVGLPGRGGREVNQREDRANEDQLTEFDTAIE